MIHRLKILKISNNDKIIEQSNQNVLFRRLWFARTLEEDEAKRHHLLFILFLTLHSFD